MPRIRIGQCYMAKLSKRIIAVRVDSTHPEGGWIVRGLASGRPTRVKASADMLRLCDENDLAEVAQATPHRRSRKHGAAGESIAESIPETTVDVTGETGESTGETPVEEPETPASERPVRMSLLDAAFAILTHAGTELNTREIVEIAIRNGMWTTHGKTPAATLHAAISRDIFARDDASRFRKGARGKFLAASPDLDADT